MVSSPRCPECDAPTTHSSNNPCWRCERAWTWLHESQDERLLSAWREIAEQLVAEFGIGLEIHLRGLAIVSWQNRVLTLAGWKNPRRWFARRYLEVTQAIVQSDKDVVLVTPRAGATIARAIQRERSQS